jgi:RES domain-containing protein
MLVYRIGKTQFIRDLEGVGSKLYGGRWNHEGFSCLYTSENRALAVLEYLVNVSIQFIPRKLSLATFEIDDNHIETISLNTLPKDWYTIPASFTAKNFGTEMLKNGVPCFKVPSVVIHQEFNYIINPLAGNHFFKQVDVQDFVYDVRLRES